MTSSSDRCTQDPSPERDRWHGGVVRNGSRQAPSALRRSTSSFRYGLQRRDSRKGRSSDRSSQGGGFLLVPRLAADLSLAGYGPFSRLLFGVSHLAVGIALLSPRLAAGATFVLGSFVIWVTVRYLPGGGVAVPFGPSLLTNALLVLAGWCRLRRRANTAAWHAMLDRHAQLGES